MDKDTRNAVERATQRARQLLEDDFASQLEGTFDVLRTGVVAARAGAHLSARQTFLRDRIVAAVDHKRAAGMKAPEAVADYLRDAAFTALNRFVALKMLEARELMQECVTKGEKSAGYKEFCGLAPGVGLLSDGTGYRLYIESLFDELSTEVKVLFDRRDPASVLWPRRQAFEDLLGVLNAEDLATVWGEDETIGWVYQFFNSGDERRAMRDASQVPRNSRELAVRNQFFTPRYVVEFLTDNTLGRIWYEMRQGETTLKDKCQYMVRHPNELFAEDAANVVQHDAWLASVMGGDFEAIPDDLNWGNAVHFAHAIRGYESAKAVGMGDAGEASQRVLEGYDERTHQFTASTAELWIALFMEYRGDRHSGGLGGEAAPGYRDALCRAVRARLVAQAEVHAGVARVTLIPHRAKKDPRDIRVLDPACGSGHFLLYAFDLMTTIYLESWGDGHISNPSSEATGKTLRDDYADEASLRRALPGLILAHNLHGVDIDARCAQIAQLALWMRAQRAYRDHNVRRADRPLIRRSNIVVAEPLIADERTASEFVARLGHTELGRVFLGLVETLKLAGDLGLLLRIETHVARTTKLGQTGDLFAPPEERIRAALARFVEEDSGRASTRRRLFIDDAAQGVGLLAIAEKKYDVVLMNPPFGAGSARAKKDFDNEYPLTKSDVYAAFVERGIELLSSHGRLGAITSRTGFFLSSFQKWREEILLKLAPPVVFADLGGGVLDSAMVETAAYCLEAVA